MKLLKWLWRWRVEAILAFWFICVLWRGVWPAAQREVTRVRNHHAAWGSQPGSGTHYNDLDLNALERGLAWVRAGETFAVWTGSTETGEFTWRNLAALAGWFAPASCGCGVAGPGEDLSGVSALVIGIDIKGPAPDPAEWRVVYEEPVLKVLRRTGESAWPGKTPPATISDYGKTGEKWPLRYQWIFPSLLTGLAMAGWWALGALILTALRVRPPFAPWAWRLLIGAVVSIPMCFLWLAAGFAGRWAGPGSGLAAAFALGLTLRFRSRREEKAVIRDDETQGAGQRLWLEHILTAIMAVAMAWSILSTSAGCVPGLGHYGAQARHFFHEGMSGFPGGEKFRWNGVDHPPGGALLTLWVFGWTGATDLHAARLVQVGWIAALASLLAGWLRAQKICRPVAWLAAWAPMGLSGWIFYLHQYYQEILLAALGTGMLIFSAHQLSTREQSDECRARTGVLLALFSAGAVLVKAEGLLLGVGAAFALAGCGRMGFLPAMWIAGGTMLGAVPWLAWNHFAGVDGTFSAVRLLSEGTAWIGSVLQALEAQWKELLGRYGATFGWWWWLAAGFLAVGIPVVVRSRQARFLWCSLGGYLFLYHLVYFFSELPLDWHVGAIHRLAPVALALTLLAGAAGARRF
jgi:hypothetical protein